MLNWSAHVKKLSFVFSINLLVLLAAARGQNVATAAVPKQLTIEQIFAEGGLTGRAPETVKWSPDGSKVSFVQRDDAGEHGELWYVDAMTGREENTGQRGQAVAASPSREQDS
jgi:Tol biopolymer transport system component